MKKTMREQLDSGEMGDRWRLNLPPESRPKPAKPRKQEAQQSGPCPKCGRS